MIAQLTQPTQPTIKTQDDDYRGSGRIGFRYLVTLIHRVTGEERLLDLVLTDDSFAAVRRAVRGLYPPVWEIWESLAADTPF